MQNLFRRLLVVVCLLGFSLSGSAQSDYTQEALGAVQRTAVIQAQVGPETWINLGSAFAVRHGRRDYRLYTSLHVAMMMSQTRLRVCATLEPAECMDLDNRFVAPLVGAAEYHPETDWASWKLESLPDGLRPAKLDHSKVQIGAKVCVSGAPNGIAGEFNCGSVTNFYEEVIVIDARIIPGNSGGPVWSEKGNVIGIVSSMDTPQSLERPLTNRAFITPTSSLVD